MQIEMHNEMFHRWYVQKLHENFEIFKEPILKYSRNWNFTKFYQTKFTQLNDDGVFARGSKFRSKLSQTHQACLMAGISGYQGKVQKGLGGGIKDLSH